MFSVKSMMRSACVAGGVAVLLASGASAAVAAPAVFSSTGGTVVAPTAANPISLSWGAAPPYNRTCVASSSTGFGATSNTGGQGALSNLSLPQGVLTCTDGLGYSYQTTITASGPALASVNAGSYSLTSPRLQIRDVGPWGTGLAPATTAVSFSVPYINGTTGFNGANPSTLTFSSTLVGYVYDTKYTSGITPMPLRLTGTLKTGTNVPLTLS